MILTDYDSFRVLIKRPTLKIAIFINRKAGEIIRFVASVRSSVRPSLCLFVCLFVRPLLFELFHLCSRCHFPTGSGVVNSGTLPSTIPEILVAAY